MILLIESFMVKRLLTKSKDRIRDHGEVFTPDFIVNDMLDLVHQETQRIESRFLEPACGDGNFLVSILLRKIAVVNKIYKKNQFDYEKNTLLAVSSIYGIDLLADNVSDAQQRLYDIISTHYSRLYKKKINTDFLKSCEYILSKNIIQWDALSLRDDADCPLIFSERSFVDGVKIKKRDFVFEELIGSTEKQTGLFDVGLVSDRGDDVFIPISIQDYLPVHFLSLSTLDD